MSAPETEEDDERDDCGLVRPVFGLGWFLAGLAVGFAGIAVVAWVISFLIDIT
jgi:hypothetical protein